MPQGEKTSRYLIVHGHFYQPPREDPWTGEVERQKETRPYHDWNELITYQCYLPNGFARVVDEKGRILDIVNNYSYLSFNFGPTLFTWLEKKFPSVVNAILEADRESMKKNNEHGNAIAQVYNHMIMPLANEKDKITQVVWGVRYFEKKFSRFPEGMWLPETAVDYASIRVLVDSGIKFIILAPHQARRIRPLGEGNKSWQDVSNGSLDTSRPYRLFLRDGKGRKLNERYIDVFFYHADLAQAVAFQKLLKNSKNCADRIEKAFEEKKGSPLLLSIATDGETFGHHHPFSDMSVAHLAKYELPRRDINTVNYSRYLEICPPAHEVEIKENTSWSCAHGVGRWKEDCGCSSGAHPEWNQKWRAPLRESLDWLNGKLGEVFQREGQEVFEDAWEARNKYIEVIMDRSPGKVNHFLRENTKGNLIRENKVKALKLLEMQRFCMFMYASCGWFFDDISNRSAIQNLKCAARAIQLSEEITGKNLEVEFVNRLSAAKSNLARLKNGKEIYEKLVRESILTWRKVFAHFLIADQLLKDKTCLSSRYQFELKKVEKKRRSGVLLKTGKGKLISRITGEEKESYFLIVHFGEHRIYCFVNDSINEGEYGKRKKKLLSQNLNLTPRRVRGVASPIFGRPYTVKDLVLEDREKILSSIMRNRAKQIKDINVSLFEKNANLIREFMGADWQKSPDFTFSMSNVLNYRMMEFIHKFEEDENFSHLEKAKTVKKMADEAGINLNTSFVSGVIERIVLKKIKTLQQEFDVDVVDHLLNLDKYALSLGISYRKYEAQNVLWQIIQKRIIPQLENMLEDEEDRIFLDHFFLLADNFDFAKNVLTRKGAQKGVKMAELRRDPIIGRWVIVSTERHRRPSDFPIEEPVKTEDKKCPFCEGNEAMTPPEIFSYREDSTKPDTPGWQIRVVPNKYPALRIEGELNRKGDGMYDMMEGVGTHEVIIEIPEHVDEISSLEKKTMEKVIRVYRERMRNLIKDPRFEYVLIFKNKGKTAGASLNHSHSQLIGTPIIPKRVEEELEGARRYFEFRERCVFCDIIHEELENEERLLWENKDFVSFCPFASRFPYEMSILPKRHCSDFKKTTEEEVKTFARMLKKCLAALNRILPHVPYNYIIHTAPYSKPDLDSYHWHMEIIPRLTRVAGFEWGTGFYINYVPAEEAAKHLKKGE